MTMCRGSERSNIRKTGMYSPQEDDTNSNMTNSGVATETNCSFSCLLELAADNDVEGFKQLAYDLSLIAEVGVWYSYQKDSKHMVLEQRTPLMIAARYGSVDIVRLVISLPGVDINYACEPEKSTALHCAASGGSVNAVEVVKILLLAGADPDATDASDNRPFDVIVAHPNFPGLKLQLQELLRNGDTSIQTDVHSSLIGFRSTSLSSCENDSALPAIACNSCDEHVPSAKEKKDYPVDPSLPNIKDSIYSTDEFRMYSFKIHHCSRAYSHDWTECPFVHPGENARRRDLRKFHYSCVPCPEFRKGACKNGDLCEYAHGIFESWLHPAQYRTRLCKDGPSCERRVCFFAHKKDELRPLHGSTGSGSLSPRFANSAVATMDMASVLGLFPGSPSALSSLSAPFSPPMSPTNKGTLPPSMALSQQGMPMLNLQTSRLRSSLNARDIPVEELHLLNSPFPSPSVRCRTVTPSNLNDLFSTEILSPQCFEQHSASIVFSPTHKSQLQLQQQHVLSPIRTSHFSPKAVEHPLMESPFCVSSPRGISPRCIKPLSPVSCQLSSFAHREKLHQELRSFKSQEFGLCENIDFPAEMRLKGQPNVTGKVDWSVQPDDPIPLLKSSPKGGKGELPDFSWVDALVKGSPSPIKTQFEGPNPNSNLNLQNDSREQAILGAWLEQLKF
ncbi:hypothetical protein SAY87_016196 [Trapa incisa]|uniref:C3H1-type domain-containing protein n=1 Tax=Trapa incisa TaxID=236973 RepID=A0AAN7L845_9MYRT|nr:hypothetical protein SAY87_016196 [Trapa incisa]